MDVYSTWPMTMVRQFSVINFNTSSTSPFIVLFSSSNNITEELSKVLFELDVVSRLAKLVSSTDSEMVSTMALRAITAVLEHGTFYYIKFCLEYGYFHVYTKAKLILSF